MLTLPFKTDSIAGIGPDATFNLPSSTRNSLSGILIVHPVATLMTLICTAFAGAAHLHSPAHSPRYLLFLLIFSFPTLLLALLAFLVDILLFVPHMAWGGWLVLVATLIITGCSVLTCAMRRTLVSRKARKKRIAENADMNGANYYASRQEPQFAKDDHFIVQQPPPEPEPEPYARAESPPPLHQPAAGNRTPNFAAYDTHDDRTPLNAREPSIKTNSTGGAREYKQSMEGTRNGNGLAPTTNYPGDPSPVSPLDENMPPGARGDGYRQRDNYFGPPQNGMRGGRGGGPPPGMYGRGRGGYPPRGGYGRGGGPMPPGARGPPPPGWNGGRGGYPPRGMPYRGGPNGMRGPPPPGWQGPAAGAMAGGAAMMGRGGRRGPPPGYTNQQYDGDDGYGRGPPSGGYDDPAMAYGQQGSAAGYRGEPSNQGYGDSEPMSPATDAYAMHGQTAGDAPVSTQEGIVRDPASLGFSGRLASASPARINQNRGNPPPLAMPSDMANEPVGQAIEMDAMRGTGSSPAHGGYGYPQGAVEMGSNSSSPVHGGSRARGDNAVELSAAHRSPASLHTPVLAEPSGGQYYEDVDPRFEQAGHQTAAAGPSPPHAMPDYGQPQQQSRSYPQHMVNREPSHSSTYTDSAEMDLRAKSPAQSDNSNFTSISQRGVNPDWQPEGGQYGGPGNGNGGYRGGYRGGAHFNSRGPPPHRQVQDSVLNNNPDFAVGGAGPGGRRGPPGGRAYHHAQSSLGGSSAGGGRYPGADGM